VYFLDVVEEAAQRIRDIIQEKNPNLTGPQRDLTARLIGLGALKYAMLSVDNTKQIVFSWKEALDFEGQSAPYIQYAHVRAASILAKNSGAPSPVTPQHELTNSEITLLDWISRFPVEVQRSAKDYKPLHLANYTYALAKAFTDFYMDCPVLQAEAGVKETRLAIVAAAKQTIANSLRLLGIEAPQSM
jgi:arginyl-tRNA synthetase